MDNTKDFIQTRNARIAAEGDPELEDYLGQLDQQIGAAERRDRGQALVQSELSKFREPGLIDTTVGVGVETAKEVGKSVLGGVNDAAINAARAVDEAGTWLNNNIIDLRMGGGSFGKLGTVFGGEGADAKVGEDFPTVPNMVPENQTPGGHVARSLTQFVVPFLGAIRGLNKAKLFVQGTKTAQGTQAAVAAAATNASAFDPNEKRLSNMLLEMSEQDPAFGKELLQFLAADENDTRAEGRVKLVLEGLGVDTAVGAAAIVGMKAYRAYFRARGMDPAEALQKAGKEFAEEAEAYNTAKANQDRVALNTFKGDERPLVDQIDEITGVSKAPAMPDAPLQSAFLDDTEMNAFWARIAENPELLKRIDLIAEEQAAAKAAAKEAPHVGAVEAEGPARAAAAKAAAEEEVRVAEVVKARAAVESLLEEQRMIPTKASAEAVDASIKAQREAVESESAARAATASAAAAREKVAAERAAREGAALADPFATPAGKGFTPTQVELVKEGEVTATEVRELVTKGVQEVIKKISKRAGSADKAPAAAPAPATPVAPIKAGDTVFYGDGESGVVTSVSKNGRLVIKDDATGKVVTKSQDAVDTDSTLGGLARAQQGGFANPEVLSRVASGVLAGLVGFNAGDENTPLSDRLMAAGLMAVGGQWAGGKGAKVLSKLAAKSKAAAPATPANVPKTGTNIPKLGTHPVANELAKPTNAGISPVKRAVTAPRIPKERIEEFIEAAKAGNIKKLAEMVEDDPDFNLANIDTVDEAKDVINAFSKVLEKEIAGITGGVRHHDQVKAFAEEIGSGVNTLKQMYKDVQNLDSRIFAHRVLLTASANKVMQLAKAAQGGSDIAVMAARKQALVHATMQAEMKGVQTEVARALSAMRVRANAADLVLNEVNDVLEGLGGRELNRAYIEKLAMIDDTVKLNKIVRRSPVALTVDAMKEIFINGILSATTTLATNIAGGLLHGVFNPLTRSTAAVIGAARRDPSRVRFGESAHLVYGQVAGLFDSLRLTAEGAKAAAGAIGKAAKGDRAGASQLLTENEDGIGSAYLAFLRERPVQRNPLYSTDENFVNRTPATEEAIRRASAYVDEMFGGKLGLQNWMGYFADALGAAIRLPGRAMLGSDEILWAMNYRGELHAQGYRTGVMQGLEGQALKEHIAQVVNSPSAELAAQAIDAARYGTFSTKLTGRLASLQHVSNGPIAGFIFPFVRTPINLMRYNFEHTPFLNYAVKQVREDIAAGGVARDTAIAKTVVGSALFATAIMLARQGHMVGSYNADPSAEKNAGVQRNSFKFGDTYYSFRKLDPAAAWFFGIAADVASAWDLMSTGQQEQMIAAVSTAMAQNVLSKSYLTGFASLIDAAQSRPGEAEKKWERYLGSMTTAVALPFSSAARMVRRDVDPLMRETNSMWDEIKNSIPGLSDTLPPRRDIFGEPVKGADALGPDWLSPISTTKAATDPARQFLLRLDIDLDPPKRMLAGSNGAPGLPLTPKLYDRLCELVGTTKINGKTFQQSVAEVAKRYPDTERRDDGYKSLAEVEVRSLHSAYQEAARGQLLKEQTKLREALRVNAKNVGAAFKGRSTTPVPSLDELISEQ